MTNVWETVQTKAEPTFSFLGKAEHNNWLNIVNKASKQSLIMSIQSICKMRPSPKAKLINFTYRCKT